MAADYSDHAGYLRVKATAPWTRDTARQLIDETKTEATKRGQSRILFDLSCWTEPDDDLTRFWSGEYLAQVLPRPFKVSAFASPENINKFGEDTAVNRLAHFRIFPDEQAAIQWLMA